MPKQASIGDTANLEEAVTDRILELIHPFSSLRPNAKNFCSESHYDWNREKGCISEMGQRVAAGDDALTRRRHPVESAYDL